MTSISIVVVHYKAKELLMRCLQSIVSTQVKVPYEIYVVDNHSEDDSVEQVRTLYPRVTVIENKENVGFARAVNVAFDRSSSKYVLVLNPDIEICPGSIESLFDYMEEHSDVALSSPKLLNPDRTLQYSCRTDYTLRIILLRRTFLGGMFPNHPLVRHHLMMDWDHAATREVDWVLGAALMLRRGAFPDNRVMDERFFLYFEDVDLCLRLRREGWKVVYHPESVMIHHHKRASAKKFWARERVEHLKSWVKFEWKHRGEPVLSSGLTRPKSKIE